jgi:choline dehydrogenase-like flavoprotein
MWQGLIRTASQMSYLGYYGDRDSWASIGYVPFTERPGGRRPAESDHVYDRLQTLDHPPRDRRWDAIVVGSGAAGSILAYRLAEAGQSVLLLERGPHVDPRDFTDDEVRQYLRLYNEGALQLATDFRLQVLQGMCVGGGTTVNNGVCFDPPAHVLDAWSRRGLDRAGMERAVAEVRDWLTIRQIAPGIVSEGARRFADGARALGLPGRIERVDTNMRATCLGTGYCNIGCAYGQRNAMLDMVLPGAQSGLPGRVDVLPGFHATEIVHDGDRATAVVGEHARRGRATIEADRIVVSAGALASSWLLRRSGIGGDRPGAELYFNVNSPMTAEFPDPVDTFAGIQMTHAYLPAEDEISYVLETWFNPPATQALAMPGWFERHYENMLRYRHMACGGALVGTTKPGRMRKAGPQGPQFDYEPSPEDLRRVVEGVKLIGRIFLAAGATRVMPATFGWREYDSEAALDGLDSVVHDNADLLLSTAHPQGGNPIGDPREGGVVGPDFRVHGFRNLWLCDASVFPSSVTVNPQLTVMAMAQHAAPLVLAAG